MKERESEPREQEGEGIIDAPIYRGRERVNTVTRERGPAAAGREKPRVCNLEIYGTYALARKNARARGWGREKIARSISLAGTR